MKRQPWATHSGVFHADDVTAAAILMECGLSPLGVRTRDPNLLAKANVRFDVGGKYDPSTNDFDHHQKGGAGCRENGVPYSSVGLIWEHYGRMLLNDMAVPCGQLDKVWALVDESLIQAIDDTDTGHAPRAPEGVPTFSFSKAISSYNPVGDVANEVRDEAFFYAVHFARQVLVNVIVETVEGVTAEETVRNAVAEAENPRLCILERGLPWVEVVVQECPQVLFVAFPDSSSGTWRLQCVPDALGSFGKRRELPAAWAGKTGLELATETGVEDAIFCHIAKFICGATSRDGVLKLAALALEC